MPSGGWHSSARESRLPPGWKWRVKPEVFALYGDVCHLCGLPGADTVDHVVPGNDHSLGNLRPAHDHPCHRRKSAQEGVDARRRARDQLHRPAEPHPGLR